jgi:hypothetical protein
LCWWRLLSLALFWYLQWPCLSFISFLRPFLSCFFLFSLSRVYPFLPLSKHFLSRFQLLFGGGLPEENQVEKYLCKRQSLKLEWCLKSLSFKEEIIHR